MAYESLGAEMLEEVASAPEIQKQTLRLVGEVAMPAEAKEEYFLMKSNDQLIIPYFGMRSDPAVEAIELPSAL